MQTVDKKIFNGVTMGASRTSDPFSLQQAELIGLLLKWTDTGAQDPVGTFTVEVSDDWEVGMDVANATWFDITASMAVPPESPATTSGDDDVDLSGLPHRWCRVKYNRTSGDGTLHGWVHARGAGG